MKTILFEIDQAEFDAIQHREKNHVIIKGSYEVGQRLILQGPEDEISLNVSHVQDGPGLMKGHCILSFWDTVPPQPVLIFDEDQTINLPHDPVGDGPIN